MEISERFGFNLPSRDGDDLADINQISDNFRIIENVVPYVDGKFDPKSQNAQNGEAVSEAVKMVGNPILKYLTYEVKENNTVNIVSCDKTIYGKHIIPEFIDGYPVTSIGANFSPGMAWAFYGCENLTEIVIPDSVEVVGANAFSACINLNGVMFGRGVKTIKASAFSECSSLNFVKMHNVIETIEIGAFEECGALSDVYYSGSAEEWGNISVGRSNDYLLQATIHFNYDPTPTTKGYVDEALRNAVDQTYSPESTNAQSGVAVAEALSTVGGGNYTELLSTEVTQENVDAAGEGGLIVVSFGNENVSFEPYNEILVCIDVPATSNVNPATTQLYVAFSSGQNFTLSDENVFLRVQGAGAYGALLENTACKMRVKGNFVGDTFLYGEVYKNGYGISYGYAGQVAGWTNIHHNFVKSKKKYVHITSTAKNYKFQVGTIIKVYGR